MAHRMSVEALLALPAVAHELRDDALDNQRSAVSWKS